MPSEAGADAAMARPLAGESACPTTTARYGRRPALAAPRPVVSSGAMSAVAFDTLHAARELEAVGIGRGRIASGAPQAPGDPAGSNASGRVHRPRSAHVRRSPDTRLPRAGMPGRRRGLRSGDPSGRTR